MASSEIPERFLRHIWQHQYFSTANLTTSDGKPVRILSSGTPNRDGGPDYKDARIQVGNTVFRGDVELHNSPEDWLAHSHQTDPHYNGVVLHVVLTGSTMAPPAETASRRTIPLLILHPFLDEKLRAVWMKSIVDERVQRRHTIPCFSVNDGIERDVLRRWLRNLGHERVELKVRRFEARLKQLVDEQKMTLREPYPRYYGNPDEIPSPTHEYTRSDFSAKSLWEQLLYEGIMEAMGFSKNPRPFLSLAQSASLPFLREYDLNDSRMMQALLFGTAGLLPSTRKIEEQKSRAYVRDLRKRWRTVRPSFKGPLLHEADWLFFRLRPNNFPSARLAAMSFLLPTLFGEESLRRLITLFKSDTLSRKQRHHKLRSFFQFEPDDFWKNHYHLAGRTCRAGIAVGSERVHDITVNGIVPIVLLYARIFKDRSIRAHALSLLEYTPPLQYNSITKIMQQQLCKSHESLDSAFKQQGAIQLYHFYCIENRCSECEIGKRVF